MMNRWSWFWLCAILSLVTLFIGLLVPSHLRAVDERVLDRAGQNTPSLIERGLVSIRQRNLGAAELLAQAARAQKVAGYGTLREAAATLAQQFPGLQAWGMVEPGLANLVVAAPANLGPEPFTEFVIRLENREKALELLGASANPAVQELLRFRASTNTVLFPPSQSASGQALDAALAIGGLLLQEGHLAAGLSNSIFTAATSANRGGNSQALELVLMDLMSLGQRFNWGQLVPFVDHIEDAETLRLLGNLVRKADAQLPVVFAAVEMSGQPSGVAGYLVNFGSTGLDDLGSSLRFGAGGVEELLRRNQRMHISSLRPAVALDLSLRTPPIALTVKWLLYLVSGFLFAAALHFARPAVSTLEQPLQVRGFHMAREFLFALGFLLVVLLLSEPFLASESQRVEFPFRLHLPMSGGTVAAGTTGVKTSFMNRTNMMTMLLFFTLQGLLYVACIVKLAEIRRQRVPTRIKLKLLENEDHLFDAGLYLGFLGTIVSFILFSLNVVHEFSLMVAYSSTSFGIIFVSFFKICHLRPVRRRLLLEAEVESTESPAAPTPAPAATYRVQ